jgi:hypothetical protein
MGKPREIARLPNAPAFSAGRSTNQSITAGQWTKVQCQTEEFDTASAYDNATNYRFTPQVAGYYQVSGAVYATGTNLTQVQARIYKNGSADKLGTPTSTGALNEIGSSVSALVYLNGTTDYVELFGYVSGTSPVFTGNVALTYFQACLVRAA